MRTACEFLSYYYRLPVVVTYRVSTPITLEGSACPFGCVVQHKPIVG